MNAFIEKIKNLACFVVLSAFIYLIITQNSNIKIFTYDAINNCITSLIPSLFFNLSVALFLVKSNIYLYAGKVLKFVAKYIFAMPDYIFSIFLISCFSGYPVGTKILSNLNKKGIISDYEMKYLPTICFSCGPSFIFSVVFDFKVGLVVFLSLFTANLITAILICHIYKPKQKTVNYRLEISSDIFFESLSEAFISVINISFVTVFFSGLISLVSLKIETKYFSPLIEICGLYDFFSYDYLNISLTILFLSFGGICVLCQIIKISENLVSVLLFIFVRLFVGSVAILIFRVLVYYNLFEIPDSDIYCFQTLSDFNLYGFNLSYFSVFFPLLSILIIKKSEDLLYHFGYN
jgi:hypothetical protein